MRIKRIIHIAAAAALLLLLPVILTACKDTGTPSDTEAESFSDPVTEPSVDPAVTGNEQTEAPATEAPTEPATEAVTYPAWEGEANAKTVNLAADLANQVTGYYLDESRTGYVIENTNAYLHYNMGGNGAQIALLANRDGKPYLENTVDTFVKLTSGTTLYASGTTGRANLYDKGFYYYDVHILDQSFTGAVNCEDVGEIDLLKSNYVHDANKMAKNRNGGYDFKIKSASDPYISYTGLDFDTADVDAVLITLKSTRSSTGQIFFIAGSNTTYTAEQSVNFGCLNDGEYHSIIVPLGQCTDYTGRLTGVRLDIGSVDGEVINVESIKLVRFKEGIPRITLDRDIIAYSDKINDNVRFLASDLCDNLAAIGTETRIPADTVDKIVVYDKSGRHGSLDGVDQNSIEYVGFDIKEAGIFGYILLPEEHSGKLTLTLNDGVYVLTQAYTPAQNRMAKNTEITVGHRLYTDPTHDFEAFLYEAFCERHPLENVQVLNEVKNKTYYAGYNALRGVYEFMIENGGGFSEMYNDPDHQYPMIFEIQGDDDDRQIYVFAHTTNGCLECAAVLDDNNRMLPLRVEVCKNFAHDGEELFYTHNDSISYGYAIFPMVVEKENTEHLTVLHLYERWGTFRLKQISSIRFHQAYYHQSLGVTETNCIAFYNYGNRLPDHRALSQPYWGDTYLSKLDANGNLIGSKTCLGEQPQHENNGTHTFLWYTTADGTVVRTESRWHHIDSSGPTYYDLTMHYVTTDDNMTASIRHIEMPQYDENRNYTQLDYEVLNAVEIKDFKNDFEIYALTTNRSQQYTKLGYLDENNESKIVKVNNRPGAVKYTLGSQYPYFDYFKLEETDPLNFNRDDIYSNVSTLIKSWDIVIGGKKYEGPLILVEKNSRVALTLDLGHVTLQPGDHIRIDMILMPWGDHNSEDDENVRLARENTLLYPIKVTSETDTVLTSDPWIPKVRSDNGSTAVFTISGGLDNIDRTGYASEGNTKYKTYYDRDFNVTARVYGLRNFGTAAVYELIDDEWQYVELAGPNGYDGYAILYDEDNTFSVSFVVNMSEAKPRTFKVVIE